MFDILFLKAEDRSATSAGRTSGKKKEVFVAPRLTFFLARRRMQHIRDTSKRIFFERPITMARQFAAFRREEEVTLAELMYASAVLFKSMLYPLAALLSSAAVLILTLDKAG